MQSRKLLHIVPALALLAGCSIQLWDPPSLRLGDGTKGERGRLEFAYTSSQCLFGCGLDRSVLQGSAVDVTVDGGDPNVHYNAQLGPGSPGQLRWIESFYCDSRTSTSTASRSVGPSEACTGSEERSCVRMAKVETSGPGSVVLDVLDANGSVVDRATFHVRPADRIDVSVKVNHVAVQSPADGVFHAYVGDSISIHTEAFSGGKSMVFSYHGLSQRYENPAVVGPVDAVILGATDTEYAEAKGRGTATVAIGAAGASESVRFQVE